MGYLGSSSNLPKDIFHLLKGDYRFPCLPNLYSLHSTGLWLALNEGMEKKMETTILGYIGFRV